MLIAGIVVLVVAVGLGVAAALVRRRSDRLRSLEKLTCTEIAEQATAAASALGAGHFRKEVATSGTLIPVGDLLTAPWSGTLCLWHRTIVRRRYEDRSSSSSSSSTSTHTRVEHDASSQQRFALSDGTTTVLLDPQRISVHDPERTVDVYEPAGALLGGSLQIGGLHLNIGSNAPGRTLGIERVEYVLRPGTQLYASGPVADVGGALLMGGRDGSTLTLSPRSAADRAATTATVAAWLAVGTAVALVTALALIVVSVIA